MSTHAKPRGLGGAREDTLVLTRPTLQAILLSVGAMVLLGGCRQSEEQDSGTQKQGREIQAVVWPGQPSALRVTRAVWDGDRTLTLTTTRTAGERDEDLLPVVCWGYVSVDTTPEDKEPQPQLPQLRFPFLEGTYERLPFLLIGVSEEREGKPGLRRVPLAPLLRKDDPTRSVVLECVLEVVDPGRTHHEVRLGFPDALASGHSDHMDWGGADRAKPLFVTLWKNYFGGAPAWVPLPEGLDAVPPQEGTFLLPPVMHREESETAPPQENRFPRIPGS